MKPIAIACGDPTGIGPEVTLKAVAAATHNGLPRSFVLVGDPAQLRIWNTQLGLGLDLNDWQGPDGRVPKVSVLALDSEALPTGLHADDPRAARASIAFLRRAAEGCLSGEFASVVTAPVRKRAISAAGIPFQGQTEFLAALAGGSPVTMMLLGADDRGRWLRVALATTHLPLRAVPDAVTPSAVLRAIRHAADACRQLGLSRARVAVCGLNPHAGEGGMFGDEEERTIGPAISEARATGADVVGPLPGDTVFHQAASGAFDAIVAMYHDQGLAPLKLLAFDTGVNWTLGLPFVRTSPDHGTAHDIAGRGTADASSMGAAIRLAHQLASVQPDNLPT